MAWKFSEAVRNARLNAIETAVGTSPVLKIRSGAPPANVAAADSGDVLATLNLPSDWLNDASGGQITKAGTWQDLTADADGDAGHFRIYDSGGDAQIQGTVTATGGNGDMTLDGITIATGQQVTITGCTLTDGNA